MGLEQLGGGREGFIYQWRVEHFLVEKQTIMMNADFEGGSHTGICIERDYSVCWVV